MSLLVQTRDRARALTVGAVSGAGVGLIVGVAAFTAALTSGAASSAQTLHLPAATRRALADAAVQQIQPETAVQPSAAAAPLGPEKLSASLTAPGPLAPAEATSSASPRDLECLTAAVYYEARGETAAGQAAVAQVVLNRVRSPAFPKSICGVVYQGVASHLCQFSFVCDGQMRRRHEPTAWDRARDIAGRALSGYVMAGVGHATHFHVRRLGHIWGGGMVRVARVGDHDFYVFGPRHAPAAAHVAAPAVEDSPVRLTSGPSAKAGPATSS